MTRSCVICGCRTVNMRNFVLLKCENGVIFSDRVAVLCLGGQRQPVVQCVKAGMRAKAGGG
jgi:hypothetical protein